LSRCDPIMTVNTPARNRQTTNQIGERRKDEACLDFTGVNCGPSLMM
jgi:hypothetical protein